MNSKTCKWTENIEESGWNTECGSWFFIEDISFDDDPVEDVSYCFVCDKKIEVEEQNIQNFKLYGRNPVGLIFFVEIQPPVDNSDKSVDNYYKSVDNQDYFVLPVDNYLWITLQAVDNFIICFARVYSGILNSFVYFDELWITQSSF